MTECKKPLNETCHKIDIDITADIDEKIIKLEKKIIKFETKFKSEKDFISKIKEDIRKIRFQISVSDGNITELENERHELEQCLSSCEKQCSFYSSILDLMNQRKHLYETLSSQIRTLKQIVQFMSPMNESIKHQYLYENKPVSHSTELQKPSIKTLIEQLTANNRELDYLWLDRITSYLPKLRLLKGTGKRNKYDEKYDLFFDLMKVFYQSPYHVPSYNNTISHLSSSCQNFDNAHFTHSYVKNVLSKSSSYPNFDKALPHANRVETGAMITFLFRKDYWCNDSFEEEIEDGAFIPIIERLQQTVDEEYYSDRIPNHHKENTRFNGMKQVNRKPKTIRIIDSTNIAGASYVSLSDEAYKHNFISNIPFSLVLEPNNPYDPKAIRIEDSKSVKLGYLPREVNDIPYRLIKGGYTMYASPCFTSLDKNYEICVYMELSAPSDKNPFFNEKPTSHH